MKSLKSNIMNRFMFTFLLIPALLAGSCTMEQTVEGEAPGGNGLRLSVMVKEQGIQTATRSTVASLEGEDNVSSLYLLFFEPGAGGQGRFLDYVKVTNPSQGVFPVDVSDHPSIEVSGAYHILALANVDDNRYVSGTIDRWMQQWSGLSANEVEAQARTWVEGASDNSNAISPDMLLMTGRIDKAQDQFDMTLELTRGVIRFDVYNNREESHDLISAEIWNTCQSNLLWGTEDDFSNDATRIARFYGVDNSANTTGEQGDDGHGDILGNIMGGLYCFENRVVAPSQNDHLTTCLIVGLRERATGTVGYYRVNISPEESSQILTANNAYRLTIRNVIGTGSPTAAAAYEASESGLDYIINYWDMTDYGLIVQDGNSILSIPAKTITFGEGGGELKYDIFTFNNSGTTSQLTIKSQRYVPSNGTIASTMDGNTLTVRATPLGADEEERTGTLIISYAGLEATVYIIQNRGEDTFLRMHLPEGGLKVLAPYAGIESEDIRIEASGPWTAELFMPDEGFTFDPEAVDPQMAITRIPSSSPLVVDNKFKVYTHSANHEPERRDCFIVVTLDSDPENYAAVAQLSQSPTGGISIVPNRTSVTFNGAGTGLAAITGNTTDTFSVRPSMDAEWDYEVRISGANDDTAMFVITPDHVLNTIKIAAAGQNLSGRSYIATLRLYLVPDPDTYTEITIRQQSLGVSLSPGTVPAISVDGGQTSPITVVADQTLQWSAKMISFSYGSPDGRSLVHHSPTLVDQNGNPLEVDTLYPMTTQFRVVFPKIYYPNRDIEISVSVRITVEGMTSSVTVNQTPLTARPMVGYGMTGYEPWGGLGNTYNQGWDGTSGTYGLAQIPGYSTLRVDDIEDVTSIPANVNYLHAVAHIAGVAGDNYDWAAINNFIDTRDAWTVIVAQVNNAIDPTNNPYSPIKRNGVGYNDLVYSGMAGESHVFQDRATPSKLYRFVMDQGHTPLTPSDVDEFYSDGVYTTIPGPWPPTAVALLTKVNDNTHASLIVDIPNKFMWIGETQMFWTNTYLSNNRGIWLDNLMYFIGNASKYGSHFTDLLLEDDMEGAQPAPWDEDYWGANAGVPSK